MNEKVAIVTGASSGIGKAIAIALAESVDVFVLVGRDGARLADLSRQLTQRERLAHVFTADLCSERDLLDLGAWIKQQFGSIDILVHSAGGIKAGSIATCSMAEVDWHYAVNLRAPFLLTQLCLPQIRLAQGQIVYVNSSAGLASKPELAAYCASKSALKAFADSLRAEENGNGIRVLSVYPGRTATPMQESLFELEGKPYVPEDLLQPDDVARAVLAALEMPRTAEVTEIMIRGMKKI